MPRPKVGCAVVLDGELYRSTKPQVSDYLLRRLSGETHKAALSSLSESVVSVPLFTLSAVATPKEIADALRILTISAPKAEEKGEESK